MVLLDLEPCLRQILPRVSVLAQDVEAPAPQIIQGKVPGDDEVDLIAQVEHLEDLDRVHQPVGALRELLDTLLGQVKLQATLAALAAHRCEPFVVDEEVAATARVDVLAGASAVGGRVPGVNRDGHLVARVSGQARKTAALYADSCLVCAVKHPEEILGKVLEGHAVDCDRAHFHAVKGAVLDAEKVCRREV